MKSLIEIDPNNEEQADEIVERLRAPKKARISNPVWDWSDTIVSMDTINFDIKTSIQEELSRDMSVYIDKEIMRIILDGKKY